MNQFIHPIALATQNPDQRIYVDLMSRQPVTIISGVSGVGKSWALDKLVPELQDHGCQVHGANARDSGYSNFASLEPATDFASTYKLVQDLCTEAHSRIVLMDKHDVRSIWDLPLDEQVPYEVLLIDELSEALGTRVLGATMAKTEQQLEPQIKSLYSMLAYLAQPQHNTGIRLVLASQRFHMPVLAQICGSVIPQTHELQR